MQQRRLRSLVSAAASVAMAIIPPSASAQTSWTAGAGDWFDAGNWSAGVPTAATTADVANGGTAQIITGAAGVQTLNLGGATGAGSVSLSGATTTLSTTGAYVGRSGSGTFTQAAGQHSVSNLYVGYDTGAVGHYQITGGSVGVLSAQGNRTIGYAGTGTITQEGGNFNGTTTKLGELAGATGTYLLNAGAFTASTVRIGNDGSGTFVQSGGTATVSQAVWTGGTTAGASGVYQLTAGLLEANAVNISPRGTFIQSGGTLIDPFDAETDIAVAPGGEFRITGGTASVLAASMTGGALRLDGGTFTTRYIVPVGATSGPSSVNVTGGTHTVSWTLEIAANSELNYSGGSLTVSVLRSSGPGAKFNFDLDPAAPFEPIHITGTITGMNGLLGVDLAPDSWPLIGADDTFVLIDRVDDGTVHGPTFQVPNGGRLDVGEGSFQVNYGPNSAYARDAVVLSSFQPVPEPAGVLIIGGAAIILTLRRRARHQ
jgi:hypothetical protein